MINEIVTERHPFDYEKIQKGMTITESEICKILEMKSTHPHYMLRLLGLREQLERDMEDLGRPIVAKITGNGIEILMDAAASNYTNKWFGHGMIKMGRYHKKAQLVDAANLTNEERTLHDRRLEIQSRILQSLKRERRKIANEERKALPKPNDCD